MFEHTMKKTNRKPYISLLLAFALLFLDVAAVNAETVIGTVVASKLNVREYPDTSAAVLTEVDAGSQAIILERSGDWYKINVGDIGYVYASYMRTNQEIETGQIQAAPTTDVTYTKGQQVVETAKKYLGVPYVYGGTSPNGFDCSGLVQYVYRQLGVNLYRVAADQAKNGVYVAKSDLQPGDLVFFAKPGRAIHHVGIYVGDGKYLHAPYTGRTVTIEAMTRSDYYTARRIFY